jgi:hypothetical protein
MNIGSLFGGAAFAESFSQSGVTWQSRSAANASQGAQTTRNSAASGSVTPTGRGEHAHHARSHGSEDGGGFGAFVSALAQALQQSGLTLPNGFSGASVSPPAAPASSPSTAANAPIAAIGSGGTTNGGNVKSVTANTGTSSSSAAAGGSSTASTSVTTPSANSSAASAATSGGNAAATASSSADPAQALFKFAQDLFAALNGQGGSNASAAGRGSDPDGDGDRDGGGHAEGREGGVRGYHSLATALQGLLSALQNSQGSSPGGTTNPASATDAVASTNGTPNATGGASAPGSGTLTATFEEASLQGSNGHFSLNITEISITETFGASASGNGTNPTGGASAQTGSISGAPIGSTAGTAGSGTTSAGSNALAGAVSATPADPWTAAIDQLKTDFAALIASLQQASGAAAATGTGSSTPASPAISGTGSGAIGSATTGHTTPAAADGSLPVSSVTAPVSSGTTANSAATSSGAGSNTPTSTGALPAAASTPDIGSLFQSFVQNMLNDAQANASYSFHAVGAFLSVTA